jgi:L-amino acid N-acyltransferase YncA
VSWADPSLVVRQGSESDAEALAELEHEARLALAPLRGGQRRLEETTPVGTRWRERLSDDTTGVAVAEVEGVVLGWLSVTGPDAWGVALIDSVYVSEGARELGLGDELVAWAMAWATQRSAHRIESWALPGDRDTKNLFERNGMTARLITVSRVLSDPASSGDVSR